MTVREAPAAFAGPVPGRRQRRRIDRTTTESITATALQVIVIVVTLAVWEVAAERGWINGRLFGSPAGIANSFSRTWSDGSLVADTVTTMLETLGGFVLGTLLGTTFGLLLWYSRLAARVLEPLAVAFNGVPKIALGPLIIIWIGSGAASKVVLAFVSTAVVALLAAYGATKEIDIDLVRLLRSFGANRLQTFTKLILPGSLPWIFSAMRINVGFALVGAVVGEFISSQRGLGHSIFIAGNLFDLNTVWLGVIVLSLAAAMMYSAVGWLESLIMKGRS